jgi:esterase/lipase superfamily enzyme
MRRFPIVQMIRTVQVILIVLVLIIFVTDSTVRAGDVWLVDTRTTSVTSDTISELTLEKLVEKRENTKQWVTATMSEFLETHDPNKPTLFVIHGNWTSSGEARTLGITIDRLMKKFEDYRLVIWTWPSERINCGIRKDAQIKARRADAQAKFLVRFLQNLKPDSKISLAGFSFGTRLVCKTLQLLATSETEENIGKDKSGQKNITETLKIRSILLAGALDGGSLFSGKQYDRALSVTEKMLIHVNPNDKTLCFYPLLVGIGGPQAVGREGLAVTKLPREFQQKVKPVNVSRFLGSEHSFLASFRGLIAMEKDFLYYALFE